MFELVLLLAAALVVGYAVARVIGKLARIGFYILLGMTLLGLAWAITQGV